jgi:hypothetical protein
MAACERHPALPLQVANGYRPPLGPQVAPGVRAVIEHCWKGLPELRPSMSEVVQELQAMQAAQGEGRALCLAQAWPPGLSHPLPEGAHFPGAHILSTMSQLILRSAAS